MYKSHYFEGSENLFNDIRSFYFGGGRRISEKSKVFEDIVQLEIDINKENYFSPVDFEKVLSEHPCFLSYVILGDEIFVLVKEYFLRSIYGD